VIDKRMREKLSLFTNTGQANSLAWFNSLFAQLRDVKFCVLETRKTAYLRCLDTTAAKEISNGH
jgi:hypothetical protein